MAENEPEVISDLVQQMTTLLSLETQPNVCHGAIAVLLLVKPPREAAKWIPESPVVNRDFLSSRSFPTSGEFDARAAFNLQYGIRASKDDAQFAEFLEYLTTAAHPGQRLRVLPLLFLSGGDQQTMSNFHAKIVETIRSTNRTDVLRGLMAYRLFPSFPASASAQRTIEAALDRWKDEKIALQAYRALRNDATDSDTPISDALMERGLESKSEEIQRAALHMLMKRSQRPLPASLKSKLLGLLDSPVSSVRFQAAFAVRIVNQGDLDSVLEMKISKIHQEMGALWLEEKSEPQFF